MVYKRSPSAESSHCKGSMCSGVSGVRMEVEREVRQCSCKLGAVSSSKDSSLSPLRQGTSGCAHIHVPMQNCATGARKDPQQYQNQEEHLLPLSVSLQRPLLTKLNIVFTARRNVYIVQFSISEQILKHEFGAERQ